MDGQLRIITGRQVAEILRHSDSDLTNIVKNAYLMHEENACVVPQSSFVRLPSPPDRFIALPAYLGGPEPVAGVKWIGSFPGNRKLGIERASAILTLNSSTTGRPYCVMDGTAISARRTAASAAVAASALCDKSDIDSIGIVGCGLINFEVARFLISSFPSLRNFTLHDTDPERAKLFADRLNSFTTISVARAGSTETAFENSQLVSIATTATVPHMDSDIKLPERVVILHVSLRDLSPSVIVKSINVVDDFDHVCREHTSIELAVEDQGDSSFTIGTIGGLLGGKFIVPSEDPRARIFSPFGLGSLDVAVGHYVYRRAAEADVGTTVDDFFTTPWRERGATGV